jgi:arylsulfatase A-like enzyme
MSEAFRGDQTSLANKKLKTTPNLLQWGRQGAIEATRAFAPSSGTYQSLGGLFGMSYPSFLSMEVWRKAWTGHFRDRGPTVAEVFQGAGYDTFWVSHNNASCFSYTVRGYDRGFRTQKLITPKQTRRANADVRIARGAVQQLERVAAGKQCFFGWVFFVSPHSSYAKHYDDMPAETSLDRYRQELRFVDEQIATVFATLDRLALRDNTIVIFTGDHGEEFGEHGGRHHKSTVYTESVHVPLLIWLPGGQTQRVTAPTSTAYLFPWLFLRGNKAMQDAALLRLRRDFGPMMERTEGAVVVELLGDQRMKSSLVYPDRKYNYDFAAELHEAYRDPAERSDLFELDPKISADAEKRMAAYLQLRSERQRFVLRPDVLDPRPDRD